MSSPVQAWRTSAARYAFSFAASFSVITGMIFITQDDELAASEILSSLGLNLIASVIFALVFSFFATEKQEKALKENLDEQFQELSARMLDQMSESNKMFLPIARYPAVNGFGEQFNIDMERSLAETSSFVFRGPSPRYVAARLKHSSRHPGSVRISMIDPQNREALFKRAADRRRWPSSRDKDTQQLCDEVKEEIFCSVVALFDYRHACPVEISYTADPSVYRYEMFDDSVYVCWYHGQVSLGKEMPEALRFSNDSFWYDMLKMEDKRLHDLSKIKVRFDASHDEAYLLSHLQQLSGEQKTEQDVASWRSTYPEFSRNFIDFLNALPGRY